MKLFAVVLVFFALGSSSVALDEEERGVLRQIRNVCVVESGLSPYELGFIYRAIRPAKKLAQASRCVIQKISELQSENETVKHIADRGKAALANAPISNIADNVLGSCQNLLGQNGCIQVLELAAKIIDNLRSRRQ
ncbi:uncharacterized protein LOC100121395 [Nasonia vitripennis]|uniref:Putative odorant binding protein 69 n=1 Tax=Nasonia vitripennis TaxID=7425 RepID=G8B1S4_NASVI|nr:uncharacterized protein LOC100121395 [Nasonia vitripennis]CCD17838.1 putative odorant binding protein 69 [Nasonia vitripennis]